MQCIIMENTLIKLTLHDETKTVNISPKFIMAQTCNDKLYYKKNIDFFLKINENMLKIYFKVVAILNNTMLRLYIKFLILEMK